jgi:glycosyltransferase involved in cell wall biosynthesis
LRTERWPGVFHTELPALGESLIDRVLCFRRFLAHWLRNRRFEAIQFRSIFEGLPLLELGGPAKLVFEVNGLPSIELKYRYPGMEDDRELMRKLIAQEQACLEAADLIVTPSGVTARYLTATRGVAAGKVRVIPNGVDAGVFFPGGHVTSPTLRMVYFWTLSPWQGVELGIRALAQVRLATPATLTIIGSGSGRERDALMALAAKLGVAAHFTILEAMPQRDLAEHLRASDVVLAPLTLNDRNLVQGCCPLKILEGMAAGLPVVASDLPVVRELGCDQVHFLLVKPGSVDQFAQAAIRLAADRPLASKIGELARARVLANYTWERSGQALIAGISLLNIS